MSRIKQNQIIDDVIFAITSITQSQCSLSAKDLNVLDEALERLQFLKRKKEKPMSRSKMKLLRLLDYYSSFSLKNRTYETNTEIKNRTLLKFFQ